MKKNSKDLRIYIIFGGILLFSIIALTVVTLVLINTKRMTSDSNDWTGYWGSLFGTFISGMITLFVLYETRKEAKEDLEEAKANDVLPVMNAYHFDGSIDEKSIQSSQRYDYIYDNSTFGTYLLRDPQHSELRNKVSGENWFNTELIMRNIGNGPMMNLMVSIQGSGIYSTEQNICLAKDDILIYHFFIEANKLIRDNEDTYGNKVIFRFMDTFGKSYEQYIKFGINSNNKLTNFDCISPIQN